MTTQTDLARRLQITRRFTNTAGRRVAVVVDPMDIADVVHVITRPYRGAPEICRTEREIKLSAAATLLRQKAKPQPEDPFDNL